jgi:hypothetical protein
MCAEVAAHILGAGGEAFVVNSISEGTRQVIACR